MRTSPQYDRWDPRRRTSQTNKRPSSPSGVLLQLADRVREIPVPRLIAMAAILVGICWLLWRILAPAGIQVNRTISALDRSIETENYWKCISLLSKDFEVPGHGYGYKDAKQGFYYLFREYDGFQLDLTVADTHFHSDGVTVQASFAARCHPSGSPDRIERLEGTVEIGLQRGLLGYRISSAIVDEEVIRHF